ncbi:MAG: CapA family protein [Clostridia bacterium]|nr:CapA family protein [Clostridia bacterium]
MKFTAAGDMIIQRRIYKGYEGFDELSPFIRQGDARFFNLETTLNYEGEAYASAFSGGTYLRTNPEALHDIKPFGFNMTSFNNNHAMDYAMDGFLSTFDAVENSGLVHSGAGHNLAEASAPKYLDTKNGRVALISVNTDFDPSMMAGAQSPRVKGRPGINGLRIEKHVELGKEDLEHIKRIAKGTNINAQKEIERREGYHPEISNDECELGGLKFRLGDEMRCVMKVNESDMTRVEKAIFEAKLQADYIMISVHSHLITGDSKEYPTEVLREFSHRCIDAGANAIVGHGPHLLRPIEIYKNSPIFYSLGDFVLQLYNVEFGPADFFEKNGLTSQATIHELLKKRSKDFTIGLMTDKRMFRSVIPYWETEGTKLKKIVLMPIELSLDGNKAEIGLPRQSFNPEIAEYLAEMCKPYGTTVQIREDGLLECKWVDM